MLVIGVLFLLSSSVIALEFTQSDTTLNGVTVDAAFRYQGNLYLISGDHFMAISRAGFEKYVKQRDGSTEVPITEKLQAAVTWPRRPLLYFYGRDMSFRSNRVNFAMKTRKYGIKRKFLQKGGPDAAAFGRGRFYIFKGCQFVSQRHTLWHLGPPQNSPDFGLPCHPDAAWTDPDYRGFTILKGNQIWSWRKEVKGPFPFHSKYFIFSWQLKDFLDGTFRL